ncbi:MAG: gliding motility-associated C-terminal domain-containing protein [Chitinophagales bacterium]|nr:gliding motility-associated C-terminal domain-containing protein [Chitinophagales bacterium]
MTYRHIIEHIRNTGVTSCIFRRLMPILLLLVTSTIYSNNSYASHAAGGELIYKWIEGNTYLITFKFYRDCNGLREPAYVNLCTYDSCSNTMFSQRMDPIDTLPNGMPNGSEVATGCPSYATKCQDRLSTLPAYREWWYQDTVILSTRCTKWKFAVDISARNPSNNIIGGGVLHIEAILNNQDFDHNNSTFFYTKPVPYVCVNQPYTYNNGAVDPDNDSLAFEVIVPLTGSSNCRAMALPVTLASLTPPLTIPNNPFQTNNTYKLNQQTGNITYTAATVGAHTTSLVVKEYRNGKLAGSTMRDIQVQVQQCNTPPATIDIDTQGLDGAVYKDGFIDMCYNKKLTFCFSVSSSDSDAVIVITDNKDVAIPDGKITYYNNLTDSVSCCFEWTPKPADSGLKTLTIIAKDSTCKAPGISISQVFTIPIRVNRRAPDPLVSAPEKICHNMPAEPLSAVGRKVLWFKNPDDTIGTPTPPTPDASKVGKQYFYVSHNPNGCRSPLKTVVIEVVALPSIDIQISKDTVCQFEETHLSNAFHDIPPSGYYWGVDSGLIRDAKLDSQLYVLWTDTGTKQITLELTDGLCISYDTAEVYVEPVPKPFVEVPSHACVGDEIKIVPVQEARTTYLWDIDEQIILDSFYSPEYYLTWDKTGVKNVRLVALNYAECSTAVSYTIDIYGPPAAEISLPEQRVCLGEEYILKAVEMPEYKYMWWPLDLIIENGNPYAKAIAQKGDIYVEVTSKWGCKATDTFQLDPRSCCTVIIPDAFTPNGDGRNDLCRPVIGVGFQLEDFRIVNRFGDVVYHGTERSQGWDGTFKGKDADVGTYYYLLKYVCNDGETGFKKGTILLLR